jgi:hypothetical protein
LGLHWDEAKFQDSQEDLAWYSMIHQFAVGCGKQLSDCCSLNGFQVETETVAMRYSMQGLVVGVYMTFARSLSCWMCQLQERKFYD